MAKTRPKDIGTAAETAVVKAARVLGLEQARRLALAGTADQGDVELRPGWVVEIKSGHQAEQASAALVADWLEETARERERYHVSRGAPAGWPSHAFLVTKRKGAGTNAAGALSWRTWWRAEWLLDVLLQPVSGSFQWAEGLDSAQWYPILEKAGAEGMVVSISLQDAMLLARQWRSPDDLAEEARAVEEGREAWLRGLHALKERRESARRETE